MKDYVDRNPKIKCDKSELKVSMGIVGLVLGFLVIAALGTKLYDNKQQVEQQHESVKVAK